MDERKYEDDKEQKGYQFVIEKLISDNAQLRSDVNKILSEKEADRAAYETRIATREAEYLEGVRLQERLKVQNESLSKDVLSLQGRSEDQTKEIVEQRAQINRLIDHERNTQRQTELNKKNITKLATQSGLPEETEP